MRQSILNNTLRGNEMANEIHTKEHAHTINGVVGRMGNRIIDTATGLFRNQRFIASRPYSAPGFKAGSTITVEVRFDDDCKNGHQSFAITGHVQEPRTRDWAMGGCIHEAIAESFPELAPLIKWHLFSEDGPMHYVANTCYHASDRDSRGFKKGEPNSWNEVIQFGDFPIKQRIKPKFLKWLKARIEFNASTPANNPNRTPWAPSAVEHVNRPGDTYAFSPKYTIEGYAVEWYECPFDSLTEAQEFCDAIKSYPARFIKLVTGYSEGKERDLDAARWSAVWPDATDEQLSAPRAELETMLNERLSAMVAEFRADMEAAGFLWSQPVTSAA
jgi:hypothetical protein